MLSFSRALATVALLAMGLSAQASSPAKPPAPAWSGVVSYVVDGDTVRVRPPGGGKPVSVRITGIDAPEICQAGGTASRDALMRKLLGQRVTLHGRRHDDYGRLLAKITFKGEDAGAWMVAQGQAWSYRNRGKAGPYAAEQQRARAAGLGIFSSSHGVPPVYPAQFRKRHGSCH